MKPNLCMLVFSSMYLRFSAKHAKYTPTPRKFNSLNKTTKCTCQHQRNVYTYQWKSLWYETKQCFHFYKILYKNETIWTRIHQNFFDINVHNRAKWTPIWRSYVYDGVKIIFRIVLCKVTTTNMVRAAVNLLIIVTTRALHDIPIRLFILNIEEYFVYLRIYLLITDTTISNLLFYNII